MNLQKITRILIIIYFVNLIFYSLASLASFKIFETFFWVLRIPILFLVYFMSSKQKNWVYLIALLFYQLAAIFLSTNTDDFFVLGSILSLLFKLFLCFLVLDQLNKKNKWPVLVATATLFVVYLYVILVVYDELEEAFYYWLLNGFFTSFLGGVAIIGYINNLKIKTKETWLLVSSAFFILQIATFFINKFYYSIEFVHQMGILFYGISLFTFYKFLILKEEEYSLI